MRRRGHTNPRNRGSCTQSIEHSDPVERKATDQHCGFRDPGLWTSGHDVAFRDLRIDVGTDELLNCTEDGLYVIIGSQYIALKFQFLRRPQVVGVDECKRIAGRLRDLLR